MLPIIPWMKSLRYNRTSQMVHFRIADVPGDRSPEHILERTLDRHPTPATIVANPEELFPVQGLGALTHDRIDVFQRLDLCPV